MSVAIGAHASADLPAKVVSEWNGRRLGFLAVCCFSAITCITCAVVEETLSAVLAFALGIMSFFELQSSREGPRKRDDLETVAKQEGVDLDSWLSNPESHTASKVLIKSLVKEYLRVVGLLAKYESGHELPPDMPLSNDDIAINIEQEDVEPVVEAGSVPGMSRKNSKSETDSGSAELMQFARQGSMESAEEDDGDEKKLKKKKEKKEKGAAAAGEKVKKEKKKKRIDEEDDE
ncbi:unnamed protein product [Amoebophrya sp. A25]|nr:unnamed protein product [Amoebophrya sp. A25]|eukprot:GSA25T00023126001.1